MRTGVTALVAAAVFFTGTLLGSAGSSTDPPIPAPVVVPLSDRGAQGRPEARNAPAPEDLDVEEVGHEVEEEYVDEYSDDDLQDELEDRREERQDAREDRREEREDQSEDD